MRIAKRITAMVLCVMFIISSFPLGVVSFGGDSAVDGNKVLSIGYYPGMTLEELVKHINKGAKLDENTPIDEWTWYTNGIADYEYGRYLIDIDYPEMGYDYENVNVIRGLEIYQMYLNGEITEQELKENYGEFDVMFNTINIDSSKLSATVDDALDAAQRAFRREYKYVSFEGESVKVSKKMVELDPETDPHCAYDVSYDIGLGVIEQTMYFPTRLELNGEETYPSILSAVENGATITAKHGEDVYTINVYGIARSEIVLTGKKDYVYPISYNIAAGDVETDILDGIYNTVVDFEKSTLADDFDINEKNGFTVRFYDKQTGWYEFDAEQQGRLEAGKIYDIEMIYEGDTTETVEFQIALFDPRINPSIAIYGDEKLVVEFTDDVEAVKKAVFESLIDKSDLPEDVTYLDFDYYYLFGGFESGNSIVDNPEIDRKFEAFRDEFYNQIWETVESNMGDHPVFDKITKEEFKEKYFTREKLQEVLTDKRWIGFDGGYYPITMEVEDTEITLFEINMPAVFAAMNHKIKVVYHGNGDYTSAEAESVEKVLQISAMTSDLDAVDGCYQVDSDVKGDMLVQSYDVDYLLVSFEIDTEYLEITNIYIDFPATSESIMNVRFVNGNEASISEYLKKYLAKENYKLADLIDFLKKIEASEFSTGTLDDALVALENLVNKLPDSASQAPINYNGLPEKKEGTYFVAAITADLDAVANRMDYGLCFIVSQLEREYQIIYSNEIPEEGFEEYPDFDFSAFVFNMDFEPYEENPIADSIFIGYDLNTEKIILSYDTPMTKGQYIQISKSSVANPVYRYFDIGLTKVTIDSPGDVFEFDGQPHGQPIIMDYLGNEIALNDNDRVIYTNTVTNESSSVAPYKVGIYSVTVIFAGRENYAPLTVTYSFRIIPKIVDVWVDDTTMIYGDSLPEFVLGCSDSDILSEIEYEVKPNSSYRGSVGEYGLVINILSLPEGYAVNKLPGKLTVVKRAVKIEMNDISIEYGEDYNPDSEGYYTVVDGDIIKGDSLGLQFEKFSNAGQYEFKPYGYTNENYDLTVEPGTITIEKKKITLTIKDVFIYEGDELPEFETKEECPEDLVLHIAPSYYTGEVGEYLLLGYNDNPNYDVTIYEGMLFVNPKPPVKVQVSTPDYSITYGDKLPEFEVVTSQELEGVEFTVVVASSYKGDVGTYPLTILATVTGENDYAFEFLPGKLTVNKKDITVKIDDYTGTYGDKFDPKAEYSVSCDDDTVNVNDITFEIGAEGYDGQVGSYLFIGKGLSRNYNVTVNTGILTIDPKLITVVPIAGQGKFEGQLDDVIDYEAIGLVGKDTLNGELTRVEGEDIGLYEILPGTLSNPNYIIDLEKVMFAVRSKDYKCIRIDSLPENVVYLQGTEFNLDGLVVVAVNADGSETMLDINDYKVWGFDSDVIGEQQITVYYKGHMVYFNVMVTPTDVLNIKIDKLPSKLIYIEGQEFVADGMKIIAFYDNGTYQVVDNKYVNFNGLDMYKTGKQTVTAEYGGKTESFEITVVTKDAVGIELDTSEVKTEFIQGNSFSFEGLNVYLVYNNGTKIKLAEGYTVNGYSMNNVGNQTITVEYGDFKAEYQIQIIKKCAVKLDISFDGQELVAVQGNKFDPTQLKVVATYNDGSVKTLSYGEYALNGYNSDSIGIWNASIEYDGLSYPVLIRVVAFSIERIEITKLPDNTIFYIGQPNNYEGIEVTVYYNNRTSEIVDSFEVYGYDANLLGNQELTVSYLGYKTTYNVTVVPSNFSGIEIGKQPNKTTYIENTTIDFTGLEVYMINGDERILIDAEYLTITGYDITKVGTQTVTVSYAGMNTTFEIVVVAKQVVSIAPDTDKALICIIGSQPKTEGVKLVVEYDNGEVESVEITPDMLGDYDNMTKGKREVTVEYSGATTEISVWFVVDEVVEILIATPATWLEFSENMEFTAEGIEILVKYADGSFGVVHEEDCEFLGFDMAKIGTQVVTVRYANETVSYEIVVSERKLSHLSIQTMPEKLTYVQGQPLDITGLVLTVNYDNGDNYQVDDVELFTVRGYDANVVGTQTIVITYLSMTVEYDVIVESVAPVGITLDLSQARDKYYLHNALDVNGLMVYLGYNNGIVESVSVDDCKIEGYDPFTLGEQTITVKYGEFTAEYTVVVGEETPVRIDLDYSNMSLDTTVGTSHQFDKLIVTALYADGTYSNLVFGAYTVEDYDYTVYGVYNASVVYGDLRSQITLTVLPEFTLEAATQGKDPIYTIITEGLVINNLGVFTTVGQLKSDLIGGEYIVITNKDGELLLDDQLVCTGSKISFVYNGITYGINDVIVKGDVDGDGVLNITDAIITGRELVGALATPLEGVYLIAADVWENNGFNITDVIKIRHAVIQ